MAILMENGLLLALGQRAAQLGLAVIHPRLDVLRKLVDDVAPLALREGLWQIRFDVVHIALE
jgi:hypothetical protein